MGIAAAMAALALPSPLRAQIVFDNGLPDGGDALASGSDQQVAEDFTFAGTTTFDTIIWYGAYQSLTPTVADAFTLELYNTTGPTTVSIPPFATFAVGNGATRTPTGGQIVVFPAYEYTYVLPSAVTLPAGTYALGISNDVDALDGGDFWFWARSSANNLVFIRQPPSQTYTASTFGNLAFRLVNSQAAAPEPGTLALLALAGVPVVGGVVRRRR